MAVLGVGAVPIRAAPGVAARALPHPDGTAGRRAACHSNDASTQNRAKSNGVNDSPCCAWCSLSARLSARIAVCVEAGGGCARMV